MTTTPMPAMMTTALTADQSPPRRWRRSRSSAYCKEAGWQGVTMMGGGGGGGWRSAGVVGLAPPRTPPGSCDGKDGAQSGDNDDS